jgi:hypothetical protein
MRRWNIPATGIIGSTDDPPSPRSGTKDQSPARQRWVRSKYRCKSLQGRHPLSPHRGSTFLKEFTRGFRPGLNFEAAAFAA